MRSPALLERLQIDVPIIQAPMAGVSTPEMAAAVSNAGALGSIGVGATDARGARRMIQAFRERSSRSLNVNVFCHAPATVHAERQARWIERLRPEFARLGATPPAGLQEIYRSFVEDDEMLAVLIEEKPRVVSFHFGVPARERIDALHGAGIVLLGSATNLAEARALTAAGVDAIVAQGFEAGGHRGVFDPRAEDDCLGTVALTRMLVREVDRPVIAAGGLMDGAGIAAVLRLGASAAQLGTAFVACDESQADAGYLAALKSDAAHHTVMTSAISGRPARCLANRFTALGQRLGATEVPDYPIAYDAGKALHAAGKAKGEFGFGAQWAGQGAPLSRPMPAAQLVALLRAEMRTPSGHLDSPRRCGHPARMRTESIDYSYEAQPLRGYLAVDAAQAGRVPGVLVVHDAGGLSDNIKEKARRLAALGYCAFALDLFGEGKTVTDGMRRIGELASALPRWRGLAIAGLQVLASRAECDASRMAAIGYCFGGTTVYELARSGADLKGVVGFHSGLSPSSGEAKNIRGKVLALVGADDPLIPPEARVAWEREMREANVDWQMNVYGNTGHSFTNPGADAMNRPGFFYQPHTDARAWAEMRRFFDEIFSAPRASP